MVESKLKAILGMFLIVSQFVVILITISLHVRGGLTFDEMTTSVALLMPMFAVHTTTVVKYFVATRHVVKSPRVVIGVPFAFLSFFFAVLFVTFVLAVILIRAYGLAFTSFDQFKATLGVAQTCFAVYIGLFISSLYDTTHKH